MRECLQNSFAGKNLLFQITSKSGIRISQWTFWVLDSFICLVNMPEENQRLQQGCVVVLEWESIALFIRRRKGSYFVGFFWWSGYVLKRWIKLKCNYDILESSPETVVLYGSTTVQCKIKYESWLEIKKWSLYFIDLSSARKTDSFFENNNRIAHVDESQHIFTWSEKRVQKIFSFVIIGGNWFRQTDKERKKGEMRKNVYQMFHNGLRCHGNHGTFAMKITQPL